MFVIFDAAHKERPLTIFLERYSARGGQDVRIAAVHNLTILDKKLPVFPSAKPGQYIKYS